MRKVKGSLARAVALGAVAVVCGAGNSAGLADGGFADATISISGPNTGSVGDVLTFTMTVKNIGDATGTGTVAYFDVNTNQFDLVSVGSGCAFDSAPTPVVYCDMGALAPGAVATGTLSLRVRWVEQNGIVSARVSTGNESNTSNNTATMTLWPYSAPPPGQLPPHPVIGTSKLPDGQVGQPYQAAIGVSSGSPPYVVGPNGPSALPSGLSLSPDGVLSGTPTEAGQYAIAILVQDSFWKLPNPGPGAVGTVMVTINPAPPPPPAPPPKLQPRVWALSFSSTVRVGRYAHLTVGVTPSARCAIAVRYAGRPASSRGLAPKRGGRLSWRWEVDVHTPAGRWPVKVDCGAAKLALRLHVMQG